MCRIDMATRKELPDNPEMDKHRQLMREIVIDYLRKYTAPDEREKIIRAATREWLDEKFGLVWLSVRGIVAVIFGYLVYLWITYPAAPK